MSFSIGHLSDLITFAVFFAVAVITGLLTGRVRDQSRNTARRAAVFASLLAASRRLSAVSTRAEAAQALAEQVAAAAGGAAIVLLPEDGEIKPAAGSPDLSALGSSAMTAARWAWEKGEAAGAGTGTLPQIEWTFWPLQGVAGALGRGGGSRPRAPMGGPIPTPAKTVCCWPCSTRGPWPWSGPSSPQRPWRPRPSVDPTSFAPPC